MSEKSTTVESPTARTTAGEVVRPVRRRLAAALAALSVPRLGAVALAALVAYFVFVVPADLTLLLFATLASVGVAALVPLAAVTAVVWFVE